MELETMNRLYLELSQFCTATTRREIAARKQIALAIQALSFDPPGVKCAIMCLELAKRELRDMD